MSKKVFVSGCFDLLHSGHVSFFKEASSFGDLYVGIGSDATILDLKGREAINSQEERLYMVKSVRYVKDAWINRGVGILDFEEELMSFRPDVFVVNEDGHSPAKWELCEALGISYMVLRRTPMVNPTAVMRSSGESRCRLPYRIDLAGTWIDQPYVSKYQPGWAITLSLEPTVEFNERCGMSTSTRNAAARLWPNELPKMHAERLAELVFRYENEPGRKEISGAQDSIGICMPGLNRHYYNNCYWPTRIESIHDEDILTWLEDHICLVLLWPREPGLNLLKETYITEENVKCLTEAADKAWIAILNKDLNALAEAYRASFEAQVRMFPAMKPPRVAEAIEKYRSQSLALKMAGAGGGGYLILLCEKPIENSIRIKVRRRGE